MNIWYVWIPPVLFVLFLGISGLWLAGLLRRKPAPPHCSSCRHWDLEEGQAVMRSNPVFMAAAQTLSPAEMGRYVVRHNIRECESCKGVGQVATGRFARSGVELSDVCEPCNGTGELSDDERSPPSAPYKAKWDNFGACMHPEVGNVCTWGDSSCPQWQKRKQST